METPYCCPVYPIWYFRVHVFLEFPSFRFCHVSVAIYIAFRGSGSDWPRERGS